MFLQVRKRLVTCKGVGGMDVVVENVSLVGTYR
jgi:hypothetical protein